MDQGARLASYVEVWWQATQAFVALLEDLGPEEWDLATDLPGWDVHAVAAHVAHLEAVLSGAPEETAEVGEPPHVRGLMGAYTEIGVVNRRDTAPAAIIAEIRSVTRTRHDQLLADPPTDPAGLPTPTPGGMPWTWETLLRNRPLDVWMHEQDVRRATGRPGGMDSAAAQLVTDYLTEGFGFVLAKRAGAQPGTTAVLEVVGSPAYAALVGPDGRSRRLGEPPVTPDARLVMDRATFIGLAGGRHAATPGAVALEGDPELSARLVGALATTP